MIHRFCWDRKSDIFRRLRLRISQIVWSYKLYRNPFVTNAACSTSLNDRPELYLRDSPARHSWLRYVGGSRAGGHLTRNGGWPRLGFLNRARSSD
jgi:hypothetical protein